VTAETETPPKTQINNNINKVFLDHPIKLSPQAHTQFYAFAKWTAHTTLLLTMREDETPPEERDTGIVPCLVNPSDTGEIPIMFYNSYRKCITIPVGVN